MSQLVVTPGVPVPKHGTSDGRLLGGCTGKGLMPGQSGNPGGRHKTGASISAAINRVLTREEAEKIARKLIDQAMQGDVPAARLLLERLDGPSSLFRMTVATGAGEDVQPFMICVTEGELP